MLVSDGDEGDVADDECVGDYAGAAEASAYEATEW